MTHVNFASVQADGLCFKLTKPCPKVKPVMYDLSRGTKDHWEIEKTDLVLKELLGSGNFGDVWKGNGYECNSESLSSVDLSIWSFGMDLVVTTGVSGKFKLFRL